MFQRIGADEIRQTFRVLWFLRNAAWKHTKERGIHGVQNVEQAINNKEFIGLNKLKRLDAFVPLGILQIQSSSESQCMASQVILPKSAAAHWRML